MNIVPYSNGTAAHFYGLNIKTDFREIKKCAAIELGQEVHEAAVKPKPEQSA